MKALSLGLGSQAPSGTGASGTASLPGAPAAPAPAADSPQVLAPVCDPASDGHVELGFELGAFFQLTAFFRVSVWKVRR